MLVSPSPSTDAKSAVARLEAAYRQARTLQATFLQRYTENGRIVRVEAGTVYFRRPGKMRWQYESPEKNVFLVDGKFAWFYVPADHTVTRIPAKKSSDWRTPLALLANEMKISRLCASVELATAWKPENRDATALHCVPRGSVADQTSAAGRHSAGDEAAGVGDDVFFEVAGTGDLLRVVIRQSGGVSVEFQFKDWRRDFPVADSFFRFDVPVGVVIENGELPGVRTPETE
jgi:outer membrane lipoprotein carrier protein